MSNRAALAAVAYRYVQAKSSGRGAVSLFDNLARTPDWTLDTLQLLFKRICSNYGMSSPDLRVRPIIVDWLT